MSMNATFLAFALVPINYSTTATLEIVGFPACSMIEVFPQPKQLSLRPTCDSSSLLLVCWWWLADCRSTWLFAGMDSCSLLVWSPVSSQQHWWLLVKESSASCRSSLPVDVSLVAVKSVQSWSMFHVAEPAATVIGVCHSLSDLTSINHPLVINLNTSKCVIDLLMK